MTDDMPAGDAAASPADFVSDQEAQALNAALFAALDNETPASREAVDAINDWTRRRMRGDPIRGLSPPSPIDDVDRWADDPGEPGAPGEIGIDDDDDDDEEFDDDELHMFAEMQRLQVAISSRLTDFVGQEITPELQHQIAAAAVSGVMDYTYPARTAVTASMVDPDDVDAEDYEPDVIPFRDINSLGDRTVPVAIPMATPIQLATYNEMMDQSLGVAYEAESMSAAVADTIQNYGVTALTQWVIAQGPVNLAVHMRPWLTEHFQPNEVGQQELRLREFWPQLLRVCTSNGVIDTECIRFYMVHFDEVTSFMSLDVAASWQYAMEVAINNYAINMFNQNEQILDTMIRLQLLLADFTGIDRMCATFGASAARDRVNMAYIQMRRQVAAEDRVREMVGDIPVSQIMSEDDLNAVFPNDPDNPLAQQIRQAMQQEQADVDAAVPTSPDDDAWLRTMREAMRTGDAVPGGITRADIEQARRLLPRQERRTFFRRVADFFRRQPAQATPPEIPAGTEATGPVVDAAAQRAPEPRPRPPVEPPVLNIENTRPSLVHQSGMPPTEQRMAFWALFSDRYQRFLNVKEGQFCLSNIMGCLQFSTQASAEGFCPVNYRESLQLVAVQCNCPHYEITTQDGYRLARVQDDTAYWQPARELASPTLDSATESTAFAVATQQMAQAVAQLLRKEYWKHINTQNGSRMENVWPSALHCISTVYRVSGSGQADRQNRQYRAIE